ncbi:rhodanese-like domain-containing protein [Viridibacillus sp. YIM B01967]|uniref:Rhodanese-like domain-containing protein n=1 Tax=Viridibacillus soli TaxID=2798301 RepID=A0ABS1H9E9_9BACL|nr:rhodanese-like domain-containing protein [Viridibacillus soli]MBK3496040.1 rhodanese-like domain-containing protein [Viridibacillus soli]
MEWIILLLGIVIFIYFRTKTVKGVKNISTADLKDMLNDKSKQLVDVRTPGEYKARHIPQFQNIPLDQLPSKVSKLDTNKEIVVICQSGMRSARAAGILSKAGFTSVYNVKGGMSRWS